MKHLSKIGLHDLSQAEVAKKKQIFVRDSGQYGCIYDFMKRYILLSILMLCGCSGGKAGEGKAQSEPVGETTENVQTDNSQVDADSTPAIKQNVVEEKKAVIDTTKIYNMGEVDNTAFISNAAIMDYISKFKYPENVEPMKGRGTAELTVERDGSVSEVRIIKGIHPDLDKEFIRLLKTIRFEHPATIDGVPVRSKLEMPINSNVG